VAQVVGAARPTRARDGSCILVVMAPGNIDETSDKPGAAIPAINWQGVVTEKDEIFKAEMKSAIEAFFGLGVPEIERVCNARRESLLAGGNAKRLMGAAIELAVAEKEQQKPFVLAPPTFINVIFQPQPRRGPIQAAMVTYPATNEIVVATDLLDVAGRRVPSCSLSIRHTTFHELIHVCGDLNNDGIYRTNWSGVEPVVEVLG
jgi:hypothetical protein